MSKATRRRAAEAGRSEGGWSRHSDPGPRQTLSSVLRSRLLRGPGQPAGQVARWPGLLGTTLPRVLCFRHGADYSQTARHPSPPQCCSPTSAARPPPRLRLPLAWPPFPACAGAPPGCGGSCPAHRHWEELAGTLAAAIHAPGRVDFPTLRTFSTLPKPSKSSRSAFNFFFFNSAL